MAEEKTYRHGPFLDLDRCPRCNIARPSLKHAGGQETVNHTGLMRRVWGYYVCNSCGGVILAWSGKPPDGKQTAIVEILPEPKLVDDAVPQRARDYLNQAVESLHAPSAAIMVAASAVDAMLHDKGYPKSIGSLYARINKAVEDHLITEEMGKWAHQVRLDANDERHPDHDEPLPTEDDARKTVEFAQALAEFMFVLPAKVERGIADSAPD